MSHLLEILGRGLLGELPAAFREIFTRAGQAAPVCAEGGEGGSGSMASASEIGVSCLKARDWAGAEDAFLDALVHDEADLLAHTGLACVLDERGETERAWKQLTEAQHHHPDDATIRFAAGFCAEKLGRSEQAEAAYRESLELAPNLRNAHERLAALHLRDGRVTGAIEHYEHICFHEAGEIDSILMLANLYVAEGRFEDAIRRYRLAITLDPENWEAGEDLVDAYAQAGMYPDAIAELHEMIRRQPTFADNHLRLGDLYSRIGREQDALAHYQEAARINPDYLEAAIKAGTSHLRSGTYQEAAQCFNRAIELNDRLLNAYVGLGMAQMGAGRCDEAAESFEMASGVAPNSALLFSEMAKLHLRSEVGRQAEKHLSIESLARPDSGEARPAVRDLLNAQIERYRRAIRLHPGHADHHYRLGLLLSRRGDRAEAIAAYRTSVRINPNFERGLTKLGLALHEAGRLDEALEVFRESLLQNPQSVEAHYRLGLIFADRNRFDLAVQQFEYAARNQPENLDFQANLALALQNMGLLDRATSCWQMLAEVAQQTERGMEIMLEAARTTHQTD